MATSQFHSAGVQVGGGGGGGGVAICEPKKQVCEAKLLLCCAHDRETVFSYC